MIIRIILIILGLIILAAALGYYYVQKEYKKLESDDPQVWESAIRRFEKVDAKQPPSEKAVLFVGSSSIRFWKSLKKDMAPIEVIRRGFGGAKLRDVIHYADRIILPYDPKAIVIFAGTNDISGRSNDKSPQEIATDFRTLMDKIRTELPQTPVYYIPITPTSKRWEIWPKAQQANWLIKEMTSEDPYLHYISTTEFFLNEDQSLKEELLFLDGVHLNKRGYAVWTTIIKEVLMNDLGIPEAN